MLGRGETLNKQKKLHFWGVDDASAPQNKQLCV